MPFDITCFAETTFLLKELISQHALSYPDVLVKRSDSPYLTFFPMCQHAIGPHLDP